MKVFISVDLEGVPGVSDPDQTKAGSSGFTEACRQMTDHANAAIEGAFAGGATGVIVADSHANMRNILPAMLDSRAELIQGSPRPLSMVQGVNEGCGAAFFLGYHAQAGKSDGLINHTYAGRYVSEIRLGGHAASEAYINAALCGHFEVPLVLLTGDESCCEEAMQWMPAGQLSTVATKRSYSRSSATLISAPNANEALREAAREAISGAIDGVGRDSQVQIRPFVVETPATWSVRFIRTGMAEMAEYIPGSVRSDSLTVEYTSSDLVTGYKTMLAMLYLAAANR